MAEMIVVEVHLDGTHILQRPCPKNWASLDNEARQKFINDMKQKLLDDVVSFTISDGQGGDP